MYCFMVQIEIQIQYIFCCLNRDWRPNTATCLIASNSVSEERNSVSSNILVIRLHIEIMSVTRIITEGELCRAGSRTMQSHKTSQTP
jgi:hypothetical protein